MSNSNAKRVMKNTLSLYLRMILLTVISLFTVRIVLSVLGEADYGLYNVVGGFVSMFSFISGTLTLASQRYFAICLSTNDWEKLKKTFSINLVIYISLAFVVVLLAETIGLWLVNNILVIPAERMGAAIWVYQFSIVNFVVAFLISPFLALLVADENLGLYSILSVVEGCLKAVIVYLLYISPFDKLVTYSALLCITSLVINGIYVIYCINKYPKLKFAWYSDIEEYKAVFSFLNWNLIGAIASVIKSQGINIIINIFFGSVVNAARALAYQVSAVISSFSQNFMKAIDPQITKKYALGDNKAWFQIIYIASKLSFFLLFVISLPLMVNMKYIFELWLGDVPKYTELFAILVIVDALILAITDPIFTAVQATGEVKVYQIVVGGCSLLNLPITYCLLSMDSNPVIPFLVAIGISISMSLGRLYTFKRVSNFSIVEYFKNVYIPIGISATAIIIVNLLFFANATNFIMFIVKCIGSVLISLFILLLLGITQEEKALLIEYVPILGKVFRIKNK